MPACTLSHSVVLDSLQPHGLQPARLLCLWNFPGKNIRVDCHFLLQTHSMRQVWFLYSFYREGNKMSEKLNNLPKGQMYPFWVARQRLEWEALCPPVWLDGGTMSFYILGSWSSPQRILYPWVTHHPVQTVQQSFLQWWEFSPPVLSNMAAISHRHQVGT